jgi:hypothetical protein
MIQPLNEQFVRMQKLAGVTAVNENKRLEEGLKFYMESMGYISVTEGISDSIKKLAAKLTPKDKYFVKLLNAIIGKLPAEGTNALMSALKYVKDNPDLSADDIKSQLSEKVNEADESDSKKGLGPLRNFLNKSKVGKTLRNAIFGLVITALTLPLAQNAYKAFQNPKVVKTIATAKSADTILPDSDSSTAAYEPAEKVGVNIDGKSLSDMDKGPNTDVKFIPFEFADGNTMTPEGQQILDDYIANLQLELEAGDVGGEITIDPLGFASNTGDGSEVSDEGGAPLSTQRADTILKYLKSKLGDKVGDVTINYGEPQHGDYKTQEFEEGNGTDGAGGGIETDTSGLTKTKEKVDPVKYYDEFHPIYDEGEEQKADINPVGLEEPTNQTGQEEPIRQKKSSGEKSPPKDRSNQTSKKISSSQASTDVESILKLNRNGQLAMVLARMSPKLNIYSELGKNDITSLSDNDFKKVQDSNASETAKKLAKLIPNLRKSPDAFLKKVSTLTGVELAPRAKAVATKPGTDTQAPISSLTETQIYLQEAAIDDLFNELGITPEEIKANKVAIIALLGSMYASAGNTEVSILDPSQLSKEEQKQLQGMGFVAQPAGNYVYMKPGDTAQQLRTSYDKSQKNTKDQPDADRVGAEIGKRKDIQRYLKLINRKDELKDLVTGLIGIIDPNLVKDKGKLRNIMFGMRNRITEEEKDASTAIQSILKNPTLVTRFKNINNVEEAIQVILREIIPYLNPDFLKKTSEVRGAIIAAANELTNAETAAARSEKAAQNKQEIKESFTRMKQLAGIIK